jgi:hypothetical protein
VGRLQITGFPSCVTPDFGVCDFSQVQVNPVGLASGPENPQLLLEDQEQVLKRRRLPVILPLATEDGAIAGTVSGQKIFYERGGSNLI